MPRNHLKNEKSRRGTSTLELAIAGPLLLLMLFGATDFARVFYHAVTLANAAGTGAFYGSQSNVYSGDFTGMQLAAKNDAKDLSSVTVTTNRYCDCPGGTKVDCITGSCPNYGPPRVYVDVKTRESFKTLVPYLGVPSPDAVGRHAYMRVQ